MNLYPNGEPITKDRMEDEDWYGYYQEVMEYACSEEFSFCEINNPGRLVDLFFEDWKSFKDKVQDTFPSQETVTRWAVFLAERHNNTYNHTKIIKAFRSDYAELSERLKDWTDWDVAMLEIALTERKTGFKEFFKDVSVTGGLPKNKFWIYTQDNPLTMHVGRVLHGLTSFGILECHEDEAQWRWVKI